MASETDVVTLKSEYIGVDPNKVILSFNDVLKLFKQNNLKLDPRKLALFYKATVEDKFAAMDINLKNLDKLELTKLDCTGSSLEELNAGQYRLLLINEILKKHGSKAFEMESDVVITPQRLTAAIKGAKVNTSDDYVFDRGN